MVDNRGLTGIWASLQDGKETRGAGPTRTWRWYLLLCMLCGWSAGAEAAYILQRQGQCLGTETNSGPLWLSISAGFLLGRLYPPPCFPSIRRQWVRLPLLLLTILGTLLLLPGWLSGVDWLSLTLLQETDLGRSTWMAVSVYALLGGVPVGWLAGLTLAQLALCLQRLSPPPFAPVLPVWLFVFFFGSAYLISQFWWQFSVPTYRWHTISLLSLLAALVLSLLLYWRLVAEEDPDPPVQAPLLWPPILTLPALFPLFFFLNLPKTNATVSWQSIPPPYLCASNRWYRWELSTSEHFSISLGHDLARFGWEKIRLLHLLTDPNSVILLHFRFHDTEMEADLDLFHRLLATLEPEFPCWLLFRGNTENEYHLLLTNSWKNTAFAGKDCPEDFRMLDFWSRLVAGKKEIALWIDHDQHKPLQFSDLFAQTITGKVTVLRTTWLRETFSPTPCQMEWVGENAASCLLAIHEQQKIKAEKSVEIAVARWQALFAAWLDEQKPEQALALYLRGVAFLPEEKRAPLYAGLAHLYRLSGRTDMSRKYEAEALRLEPAHSSTPELHELQAQRTQN